MASVMTIGGGEYMGRFTVAELLADGHDVTLFTRGRTPIPHDEDAVDHVQGDRTVRTDLEAAAEAVDPDVVIDFPVFHPEEARAATEVFADVDAYVAVSSTHAYERGARIPYAEDVTPLEPCTEAQAADDTFRTYGNRKAANDREVFAAAERGVNAMSARPCAIIGPHDPTERQDYWIKRVADYDRIVVPGDAARMPIQLGYVRDAARAMKLIAFEGEPGEAYNVAARNHLTYDDFLGLVAESLDTTVELLHATDRELSTVGLSGGDFSLYEPYPYLVSTEKLAALGYDSTPFPEAVEDAVRESVRSERDGAARGPDRETEEELIEALGYEGTVVGTG